MQKNCNWNILFFHENRAISMKGFYSIFCSKVSHVGMRRVPNEIERKVEIKVTEYDLFPFHRANRDSFLSNFTLVLRQIMKNFCETLLFDNFLFLFSQEHWNAALQTPVTNLKCGLRFGSFIFRDFNTEAFGEMIQLVR